MSPYLKVRLRLNCWEKHLLIYCIRVVLKAFSKWVVHFTCIILTSHSYCIPCNIFTATVIVDVVFFFNEGTFIIPLHTLPKAPWPSSSPTVTSSLFTSHLSFFPCTLLLYIFFLQHQFSLNQSCLSLSYWPNATGIYIWVQITAGLLVGMGNERACKSICGTVLKKVGWGHKM